MTTVAELVTRTATSLRSFARDKSTQLTAAMTDSAATCAVEADQGAPQDGDYLAIDYEVLQVHGGSPLGPLDVHRGLLGTTAAAHADNSIVYIAPKFPAGLILQELRNEVRSWPRHLYREYPTVATVSNGDAGAELLVSGPGEIYQVLRAQCRRTGSTRWKKVHVELIHGLEPGTLAQGYGVQIRDFTYVGGIDLHCVVAMEFDLTEWEATTDLEEDCGIPAAMHDIAVYGAGARLLMPTEAERNDLLAQGQSRDTKDVPASALTKTAQTYQLTRNIRISQEIDRLRGRYGVTF